MSTNEQTKAETRARDMADRMRYRTQGLQSESAGSGRYREPSIAEVARKLALLYGEAEGTWQRRLSGEASCYRHVQRMNGVLRMMRAPELLTELNIPVELSLGPEGNLPIAEALHLAECADAGEQMPDESFRYKLSHGTATVAEARAYLKASAVQCARAEVARREVAEWIAEQEAQR